MPALEEIDHHFGTSRQVQRYLQMRAGELKPYMHMSGSERALRRNMMLEQQANTSSLLALQDGEKTKKRMLPSVFKKHKAGQSLGYWV